LRLLLGDRFVEDRTPNAALVIVTVIFALAVVGVAVVIVKSRLTI
jgi:hypothetical protein